MSLVFEKNVIDDTNILLLNGRLDTTTAPDLEKELDEYFKLSLKLILDFTKLEYVSSAGLRVLLKAQKILNNNLVVKNVNETVMEVFEITGFVDILNIE